MTAATIRWECVWNRVCFAQKCYRAVRCVCGAIGLWDRVKKLVFLKCTHRDWVFSWKTVVNRLASFFPQTFSSRSIVSVIRLGFIIWFAPVAVIFHQFFRLINRFRLSFSSFFFFEFGLDFHQSFFHEHFLRQFVKSNGHFHRGKFRKITLTRQKTKPGRRQNFSK